MCWRDDIPATRHCSSCGATYYGDLGHRGCPVMAEMFARIDKTEGEEKAQAPIRSRTRAIVSLPELNPREVKAAASVTTICDAIINFDLTGLESALEKKRERMRLLGWGTHATMFKLEQEVIDGVKAFRKLIGQ